MATKGKTPGYNAKALRAGGVLNVATLSPALSAQIDKLDDREVKTLIDIHSKIKKGMGGELGRDAALRDGNFFW